MTWIDGLVLAVIFSALVAFARMWWRSRRRNLSDDEIALVRATSLLVRVWLASRMHDRGDISADEFMRHVKRALRLPDTVQALSTLVVMSGLAGLSVPTIAAAEDFRAGRIEAADFMAVVERVFEIRE
jgi:hypothetical protein